MGAEAKSQSETNKQLAAVSAEPTATAGATQTPSGGSESQTKVVEISFDDEPQGERFKETLRQLKFYGLPLFSFAIFIAIVVGTIIPNITQVFAAIDEINSLRTEDEELVARTERLQRLQQENAASQATIDKINQIVPTGKSEVVGFARRVGDTVAGEALILENSKTGEDFLSDQSAEELQANQGLVLIEIPSEFTIRGEFNNFRNLLNQLYEGDDFFVVDEMNLRASPNEESPTNWSASINLAKYQFFVDSDFDITEFYSAISEKTPADTTVIRFLETRFLSLEEESTEDAVIPTPTPTVSVLPSPTL
ncbi:MAG: hypothetical protein ACE5DX_06155 [Candidatus Dojkabacteria bacterium]